MSVTQTSSLLHFNWLLYRFDIYVHIEIPSVLKRSGNTREFVSIEASDEFDFYYRWRKRASSRVPR